MPDFTVEITAGCTVVVLNAKDEAEALEFATGEGPIRARYVLDSTATAIKPERLDSEARYADEVIDLAE